MNCKVVKVTATALEDRHLLRGPVTVTAANHHQIVDVVHDLIRLFAGHARVAEEGHAEGAVIVGGSDLRPPVLHKVLHLLVTAVAVAGKLSRGEEDVLSVLPTDGTVNAGALRLAGHGDEEEAQGALVAEDVLALGHGVDLPVRQRGRLLMADCAHCTRRLGRFGRQGSTVVLSFR